MSRKKQEDLVENYTFLFRDGYYVTFPLKKSEFLDVQRAITLKTDQVLLENYVILLHDLRYVAKQEKKQENLPDSAVPEYMEQDVYEYVRSLEREMKNG